MPIELPSGLHSMLWSSREVGVVAVEGDEVAFLGDAKVYANEKAEETS